LLAPLIPRAATGRPRVEDRRIVNGTVCKPDGVSWRDPPERYGPWKTVCTRFRRYALDGLFTRACSRSRPARTRPGTSTGWSRSTPPSSPPTSTPPTGRIAALNALDPHWNPHWPLAWQRLWEEIVLAESWRPA
jgi:transposase